MHLKMSKINNSIKHVLLGFGVCAGYDGCKLPKVCVERGGHPVCECEACDSQLSEVCGSDGITYANECKLRLESCITGKPIYQKYSGVCGKSFNNIILVIRINFFLNFFLKIFPTLHSKSSILLSNLRE